MATSGSANYNRTANEIIDSALRKIGAIATGETPEASERADALEALNIMVKAWQAEGLVLWLQDRETVTLVVDQESYLFGIGGVNFTTAAPLEIIEARYHSADSDTEMPMIKWSRQEYFDQPLKSATGIPTQFYYEPLLTTGTFFIWPVLGTSSDDDIRVTARTTVEDFDSLANDPDLPAEWLRALIFNLAVDVYPEYWRKDPPQTLLLKAEQYRNTLMNFDREDTYIEFALGN
ncbi:hypothetical protein CMI37_22845 [Candidatus Pacearchaeota archaeon]|nr:hypothetical protein [Candidatus Pacearchaeota archaeon]|tara:strand:+ start:3004 stop:3705 length:702 start_codon:yes stop_codon:yes gene_type:complete